MVYDHKEENYVTEEKFSENYISIIKHILVKIRLTFYSLINVN